MKTGKRPRRLTKLVINEVSSVDAAANPGARVVIMKRARPRYAMNGAFSLVRVTDDGQPTAKSFPITDEDRQAASVAKALAEIQDNKEAVMPLAKEFDMETDIIKSMDDRVTEVVKATGCSDAAAMRAIAESRSPEDRALFDQYKAEVAPASTVTKEFNVEKAVKKMSARVDELIAAGVARTRESAVAKIAMSPLESDQRLWARYRASGQTIDNSTPLPVGKISPSPTEVLIRTLMSSYNLSREEAAAWARRVQAKEPPAGMLGGRVTVA